MELTAQRDGWIQVSRKGIVAYIAAADVVSFVECGMATDYLTQPAPMYKSYGSSAKYGAIPAGEAVQVYALAGDWDVTITKGLYAYASCDGAPVYQSWSTSSKVFGALSANAAELPLERQPRRDFSTYSQRFKKVVRLSRRWKAAAFHSESAPRAARAWGR